MPQAPWFIGLLTIFLAYRSGFIDNKATLNEMKALRVEDQVKEFEARRDSLHRNNDSLLALNSRLNFEREKLKTDLQKSSLALGQMKIDERNKKVQMAGLGTKINNLQNQLIFLDKNLKKKISDTSQFYQGQAASQVFRTRDDIDRIITKNQILDYNLAECEILRKRLQVELANLKKTGK